MFQVNFTRDGIDEKMRTGTAAGIYESGCYGHCCGELDQRALLAVAVALLATGVETQGRHQPVVESGQG